ncbi:hypothetical protein CSKR_106280 [Clonorchis sinensis]|uniref:Uncharacterized protein n=1 Tax=Clonorchis sinensis TaxID=79923 RepID=A0A419PZC0_CLOSI|nr:hypothetical protein CSKR_106280 [Clonorchis sinensis]
MEQVALPIPTPNLEDQETVLVRPVSAHQPGVRISAHVIRIYIDEIKKSFSCSTILVPNCHANGRRHEGWDTARWPKPRQGRSRCRARYLNMDLAPYLEVWESRSPHPGRRVAPTAPRLFAISFIPFCQVRGWPPPCFHHSELDIEKCNPFGKPWCLKLANVTRALEICALTSSITTIRTHTTSKIRKTFHNF